VDDKKYHVEKKKQSNKRINKCCCNKDSDYLTKERQKHLCDATRNKDKILKSCINNFHDISTVMFLPESKSNMTKLFYSIHAKIMCYTKCQIPAIYKCDLVNNWNYENKKYKKPYPRKNGHIR